MKRILLSVLAAVIATGGYVATAGTSVVRAKSSGKEVVETGIDAAKLWAQTCTRCHNARPATTYSDAQWGVIMHHMRVRAYLTGEEARAVLAFLQEGN